MFIRNFLLGLLAPLLVAACLETEESYQVGGGLNEPPTISTGTDSTSQDEYWLRAISINTEWLWDASDYIDGVVLGADDLPSPIEYMAEINYFADLIERADANLVGLQEMEGCHIVDDIVTALGAGTWYSVCATGRDTYTGQDVGIVSQFPIHAGPFTFPAIYGEYGSSSVRPSKIVGAVLDTPLGNLAVVNTHLLSKLNPDNDERRAAQADAVLMGYYDLYLDTSAKYGIVMGDLNDTPSSRPLTILTGSGALSNTLYANNRVPTAADCTYTYNGSCELIDHILVSSSLSGGTFGIIETDPAYTDHDAVLFRARTP